MLASVGAAVRNWVTSHGAFLNIDSPSCLQRQVESNPIELASIGDQLGMASMVSENESQATIVEVAKVVASHLADSFGCSYRGWQVDHPLLSEITEQTFEKLSRTN